MSDGGGIDGLMRTMEENEKRVERYRRGLETRLKAVKGNMMDLGKMLKMGVMSIKADQYELRKAIERDDKGMRRDNEGNNEVTEDKSEDEETKGDEDDKGTKEDGEDKDREDKEKEDKGEEDEKKDKGEEMVDEMKKDGEDKAEVMAEVMAETMGEVAAPSSSA